MPIAVSASSADIRLVFAAKAARTFCYGFLGILLPLRLADLGYGATGIGMALTLTLTASAALTWAVRRPAERYGSRWVLLSLATLSGAAAVLLLVGQTAALVIAGAMLGNVAVGAGETGPFLALEQVVVARATPRERLTWTLALYNLLGYVAAALGAATTALASAPTLFAVFLAGAALQWLCYQWLPSAARPQAAPRLPLSALPSVAIIRRLSALFALDSLAGGLVVQSLIAYWFHVQWGFSADDLAPLFFGTQLLSALSFLAASRLAARLGLVNTMVFTHLFSNVLLIAVTFAPAAGVAVALLLARQLFSQMDVPTRQAYVMSVVEDHEREAAASVTNLSRTVAQAIAPALTGYVMQAVTLSAPFALGGILKIVYDLLLYATFRHVKPRR